MAFVYVSKKFTSTVTAFVDRRVCCEKCGAHYVYRLTRRGSGSGVSPYMLDNESAKRQAQAEAVAATRRALTFGVKTVPCPACGWMQAHMVAILRRAKHAWMHLPGIVLAILGVLVLGMCYANRPLTDSGGEDITGIVLGLAGAASVIGVVMVAVRFWLLSSYDPNENYAARAGKDLGGRLMTEEELASAAAAPAEEIAPGPVVAPPTPKRPENWLAETEAEGER